MLTKVNAIERNICTTDSTQPKILKAMTGGENMGKEGENMGKKGHCSMFTLSPSIVSRKAHSIERAINWEVALESNQSKGKK